MYAKCLVVLALAIGVAVGGIYDGLALGGHAGGLALGGGYRGGYGGYGGYGGLRGGYGGYAGYAAPVAVAHAAPAVAVTKIAAAPVTKQVIDYVDAHPAYKFDYAVHDAHTGDVKEQSEERDGDVVHGSYSLVEPDGTKRIVEYTADPHNGFNAIVHREHNAHPQVIQKVAVAPVAVKAAAPVIFKSHY